MLRLTLCSRPFFPGAAFNGVETKGSSNKVRPYRLTPITATDGQEALAYPRGGGAANLILLDLGMPIMDGWTFCREQRRDPAIADIPIVVLSGAMPNASQSWGRPLGPGWLKPNLFQ